MASANQHYYPDYLNPFGSDDEGQSNEQDKKLATNSEHQDYPDYLSPFVDEDNGRVEFAGTAEDYDDSLNPFGDEQDDKIVDSSNEEDVKDIISDQGEGNPFADDGDDEDDGGGGGGGGDSGEMNAETSQQISINTKLTPDTENAPTSKSTSPQPESLESPPVPLPRTKSLLKKEQAQRNKQLQKVNSDPPNNTNSLLSTTSSTSPTPTSLAPVNSATETFQRKKNKRNAPPVPINFKREVSGSLDAIEEELNEIGDELAILEKESYLCQQNLKVTNQVDETQFAENRIKFIELIKRKNSIVRRQKELMYRKRELKLNQIHSDIEYELRMIGNKQLSHRTPEDDIREKELLKKLVEIVEEKSDIVENLNKDSSCDSHDIGEAFRRLNLTSDPSDKSDKNDSMIPSSVSIKHENCDKSSATVGVKLSKIATLLPKGGTLKGTMKIKRKRLFKKV